MKDAVCFEQPLNERIRSLLRLEFLFDQLMHAAAQGSNWDTRTALHRLLEILDIVGRTELRSELLKELERQSTMLTRLRQTPGVDPQALAATQEQVADAARGMHAMDSAAIERVRQTDFLCSIRQRSSIHGGTCRFDLPALHHWLSYHNHDAQTQQLTAWVRPLQPLQTALRLVLKLVRDSALVHEEVATGGFFQRSLDSSAPTQMVRVFVPWGSTLYPEISGGRHRVAIRFLDMSDPNRRPVQSTDDVPFQLARCVI